jgi:SNF2 family DNA or RNA helicase
MIRLHKHAQRITWEHEDVRMMAKILGGEFAVIPQSQSEGWAPALMSILKLAKRKGMLMSPSAERALQEAEEHYDRIVKWKTREDATLDEPRASHYFPHQRADLSFLYKFKLSGVLLASEAGVGKTIVAARYTEHVGAKRIGVVVPNSAKDQWASELGRWSTSKLPIQIVEGTTKQQIEQVGDTKRGWVIGHWESLVHARPGWLANRWDMVILDEAQNMQNRNAQRTMTAHRLKKDFGMAITAHPYANSVAELFPILKFLYPDLYPAFWRWAQMHIEIEDGAFGGLDLRTPRRPKLLAWEIAPFTIRRLWKDVWKNLPPITRMFRTAHLTTRGEREYKKLRKQFFVELRAHKGEKNILAIPSMLARITRLRQYLVDPGILGAREPSVKYPMVHELVQELEGFPPVIFTMWRDSALRLQAYLEGKGMRIGIVVGGMGGKKINRVKRRFLEGMYDAVIIMIKVGGTALNFGKYGKIIYLDHPWNHRDVEQTEGRVRRPEEGTGIIVPAMSYNLIVKDSYEERMFEQRQSKHVDFGQVFTIAQAREFFDEE